MNNNIERIANILNDKFKNDKITKLEELKAKMSIDFVSNSQKFISFRMDKELNKKDFPNGIFPFFYRGIPKVCSFCDYIIFSELRGKLFILLIELKRGKNKVTTQLDAGECFVNFVINTANRVNKTSIKAEIRKIAIRDTYIKSKGKTQKQKEIKYDNDNFHTFQDSKFWLKKYLV